MRRSLTAAATASLVLGLICLGLAAYLDAETEPDAAPTRDLTDVLTADDCPAPPAGHWTYEQSKCWRFQFPDTACGGSHNSPIDIPADTERVDGRRSFFGMEAYYP